MADMKIVIVSHILGFWGAFCSQLCFKSFHYFESKSFCYVQDLASKKCLSLYENKYTGEINCALTCSTTDECPGFSLDSKNRCYIPRYCQSVDDPICDSSDDQFRFFTRNVTSTSCLNGGVWIEDSNHCQCSDGFVGDRCQRYADSCKELNYYGYPRGTRLRVKLKSLQFSSPFRAYCFLMLKTIYTIVAFNSYDGGNFTRPWQDYVNGFEEDEENPRSYWIGLEKLHYFTVNKQITNAWLALDFYGTFFHFNYRNTKISDESTNFAISYTTFLYGEGGDLKYYYNFQDCFDSKAGIPFSTPDVDNDQEPSLNCADMAGAGWWFSECSPTPRCNPLGINFQSETVTTTDKHVRFYGGDIKKKASDFKGVRIYLEETFQELFK